MAHEEIIRAFQQMRQNVGNTSEQLHELQSQDQEHTLVLKTLEPMPSDRKCYRLIGGVLVQQTVAEVRPAVESNSQNLKKMVKTLAQRLENQQKELLDHQEKYKIRVKNQDAPADSAAPQRGSQGVLTEKPA